MAHIFRIFIFSFVGFLAVTLGLEDSFATYSTESSCCNKCNLAYTSEETSNGANTESCLRGCRFFSILDTVEQHIETNATRKACASSCTEAYEQESSLKACIYGCDSQEPFFSPMEKYMLSEIDNMFRPPSFDMSLLYPFMYSHDGYGNIVDKMHKRTQVSWSFYVQNGNGKMVVIRSQPSNTDYYPNGDMTQNYMETNLEPMDNSATPNLRSDSFYAQQQPYDLNLAQQDSQSEMQSGWLGCLSSKTGLPKVLLTFAIFLSALGMIWLAFSTTVTASEQRITTQPQKLSMYGDLEYLKCPDYSNVFTKVSPIGPDVQAPPLPVKIKIDTV